MKKKKAMTMFLVSTLVASSLTACDFNRDYKHDKNGDKKLEQSISKKDLKGKYLTKLNTVETFLSSIKLPSKKQYKNINGARMLDDGNKVMVIYEFVTKENKFYNFSVQKGEDEYKRISRTNETVKKKTPLKKEYVIDKNFNEVYWLENRNTYSLNSDQLDEKQIAHIIDSVTQENGPKKLLAFNPKNIVFPKYITKSDRDSKKHVMVELYGKSNVEVDIGNEYASVIQIADPKAKQELFENIKEYKREKKLSPKNVDKNPYFDAFETLNVRDGEAYIQVYQELSSETYYKKGTKYFYIRVDGNSLKAKEKKDYFIKETQKIIEGIQ